MGRESVCGVRKSEASGSSEPWHVGLSWSSRWVVKVCEGSWKSEATSLGAGDLEDGAASVSPFATSNIKDYCGCFVLARPNSPRHK